ncbi:MAG: hypothetical protein MUC72_10685 [Acidobacteria bacterium]|nr:hypothetical protein [Acidobacteriota bacterium]
MSDPCLDAHPLRIAGIRFDVRCPRHVRLRKLNPLYRKFVDPGRLEGEEERIRLNMILGDAPGEQGLDAVYTTGESWSMQRDHRHSWIRLQPPGQPRPFWAARFDRGVRSVDIYVDPARTPSGNKMIRLDHPVYYPLDQLLLMNYLARHAGALMHAAGMVSANRAYLFAGASGAGKSTFAQLLVQAKAGRMLSDERIIVRGISGKMVAFGTPWAGTAGIAGNGSAPLTGLFLLRHGLENRMTKLAPDAALDRLLPLLSIPWYDAGPMARIIAFAKKVAAAVPCYEFSFIPDPAAVVFFREFKRSLS